MSLKYLLIFFCFFLTVSGSGAEFKYSRPVKAVIKVSAENNEYRITGIFEREKHFSASHNRAMERKYVRLLAEDALRRYLKGQKKMESFVFSGADISSNLAEAKPDEKITFTYIIPFSGCKQTLREKSENSSENQTKTSAVPPSLSSKSPSAPMKQGNMEEQQNEIIFEIASPDTIFDSSWSLIKSEEMKSRQSINRIISDFENKKY